MDGILYALPSKIREKSQRDEESPLAQRFYFKSGKVVIGHPGFCGREIFNPSPITAAEMY